MNDAIRGWFKAPASHEDVLMIVCCTVIFLLLLAMLIDTLKDKNNGYGDSRKK